VNLGLSLREQGVKGLYKGLEAKLLQTVSTTALMFEANEKSQRSFTSEDPDIINSMNHDYFKKYTVFYIISKK